MKFANVLTKFEGLNLHLHILPVLILLLSGTFRLKTWTRTCALLTIGVCFLQVKVPLPSLFSAIRRYLVLSVDASFWEKGWVSILSEKQEEWKLALANQSVEEAWKIWSCSLEIAAGIPSSQAHRFRSTELVTRQVFWKGPRASRMPVHERRLHRMWRRVVELELQVERSQVDAGPLRKVLSGFRALHCEGFLSQDFSEFADMRKYLNEELRKTAAKTSADRLTVWREGARKGGMKALFDLVGNKTRPGLTAVQTLQGPSADPAIVQACAGEAWSRKMRAPLSEAQRISYLQRVRPFLRSQAPPPEGDEPFRLLLQGFRSSAPGPAQWAAEALLKPSQAALERLVGHCYLAAGAEVPRSRYDS